MKLRVLIPLDIMGVVERRTERVQGKGRALLIKSQAPIFLWDEAMLTTTYLINQQQLRFYKENHLFRFFLQKFPQ